MSANDIQYVFQWWIVFFAVGIIFLPLSNIIFSSFIDRGYIFSKIIGIIMISYVVFVLGTLHILPFNNTTIFVIAFAFLISILFIFKKGISELRKFLKIYIFEEILFLAGIFFWSYVRSFNPDIHGLEKYMDFGFINSIIRSNFFPPKDMWYTPYPINYYYFGHLVTAVITKFSGLTSNITFNLMLATIFAFTFTCTFSIGTNLIWFLKKDKNINIPSLNNLAMVAGGILSAFLITFGGNLHTMYMFFRPYENESPVPPWSLVFSPFTFPNQYWYPNATRFIYHTIHEFPIYSFVVSDLHGHVLDIPFVLLTIAVLFSFLVNFPKIINVKAKALFVVFVGFLLSVMYMTNAWDGLIYMLLSGGVIAIVANNNLAELQSSIKDKIFGLNIPKSYLAIFAYFLGIIFISFEIFALPFSLFFNTSEIVHGIGILCAGDLFPNVTKIGPFLFEPKHCQHSPWWQMGILYGFFYFFVIVFVVFLLNKFRKHFGHLNIFREIKLIKSINSSDLFVVVLIILSTTLIIIPEFFYLKDIYPEHYRANTMFKLVYQSFMMLMISSSYIFVRFFSTYKKAMFKVFNFYFILFFVSVFLIVMVMLYPYFAINSYYSFQTYKGLDGMKYLQDTYTDDYEAINWLNKFIPGQPVILEAQGDSYTDYARVSANTGLPTPLGWTVHEWLWRGSYDPLPERFNDIQTIYETDNLETAKSLIKKYNISLIFIGSLEHQKYKSLREDKFTQLGKVIFRNASTTIYQID